MFRALFKGSEEIVDDRAAAYGHLIIIECYHLSAHSFELVTRRATAASSLTGRT